jgi:hypothetical protein
MPAAASTTTTHSTTMSDSAAEVGSGATKTLSSRRRPAVLGVAVAGIGLVVVVLAMLLKPGTPTGTTSATVPPTPVPTTPTPTPTPTNLAVETATPTETTPKTEAIKENEAPKEEPKVESPSRPVVVEVSSDPSGAEVWLPSDTEARGHTPFKVALDPKADPTHVVLKAHGYADKGVDIDPGKPETMSVKLDRNAPREHAKKKTEPGEKKPPKDDYRRMGD